MVVSEGKLMARPLQAGRFIAVGGPRDSCSAAPAGPRQTRGRAFWLVPASCNAHHSCLRGRLGRPTALAAAAGAAGGRGRRPLVRAATCATSKIYVCARHSRLHGSTHAHPWQPCCHDNRMCSGKAVSVASQAAAFTVRHVASGSGAMQSTFAMQTGLPGHPLMCH